MLSTTQAVNHSIETMCEATAPQQFTPPFPPLELVTKPNLITAETAYYLNRAPQTLRVWAMRDGSGPIRPKRIGGILAWSTLEVKALAGVAL